jgi:hypothetical protein
LDNSEDSFDNLIAAFEHCDRVRLIHITNLANFLWEEVVTAMDEPFPALRSLWFDSLSPNLSRYAGSTGVEKYNTF